MLYWSLKFVGSGRCCAASGDRGSRDWRTSPSTAAAILASNHLSFSDSFFMPLVVPRAR